MTSALAWVRGARKLLRTRALLLLCSTPAQPRYAHLMTCRPCLLLQPQTVACLLAAKAKRQLGWSASILRRSSLCICGSLPAN